MITSRVLARRHATRLSGWLAALQDASRPSITWLLLLCLRGAGSCPEPSSAFETLAGFWVGTTGPPRTSAPAKGGNQDNHAERFGRARPLQIPRIGWRHVMIRDNFIRFWHALLQPEHQLNGGPKELENATRELL